ncbi:mannose-1-phosphate guanylyltransferase/mannose-6-phosphate isomerase [Halomonas sp. LR5S13]|uniref:mannose-1-phosphate guanylyltransferase/mannose-6-phosphate isomerase n=1 Tax=Halomonas rhizosphaerae TaxID=3043296 RepID=UPI0024A7BBC1|nr:mannose-1-phosphate guanylyltransferase/mannose-6-phosphate isomerase [Halomonas rhizosphaerae]MDI5923032.1 mannose-1-phosphate guanylyltransferase/mannose-6-phosphate isomerase [Halomonas rhizosphaerae]
MFTPVILAGGNGVRLWPLSRRQRPKQFLSLEGEGSLLANTLSRLEGLGMGAPIVICHEEHRFLAAEQLRQAGVEDASLLLEPEGRGTAPAIALAALLARSQERREPLLVLPSDHHLADDAAFRVALGAAARLAEAGHLVTFGVVPTRAETGYGYLQAGEALGEGGHAVARFVEKPDLATAERFLAAEDHFWNSGMFVLRPDDYLDALEAFAPAILAACRGAMDGAVTDLDFLRPDARAFLESPADSIDVAVMERTDRAAMVPLAAGWSDIGSWQALWEALPRDADDNALRGDVVCEESRGLLVHADSRLVATLGVQDLVIVETDDAVLVAERARSQQLRGLVERLEAQGRRETRFTTTVHRPWGHYLAVDAGPRHQVKRITVRPGARLSLQLHHHRAEHWVVVSGTARVTLDDEAFLVGENASTFIPVGRVHCLENPGLIPLELIEVQSGTYLGEDDIVRLDDCYGRT